MRNSRISQLPHNKYQFSLKTEGVPFYYAIALNISLSGPFSLLQVVTSIKEILHTIQVYYSTVKNDFLFNLQSKYVLNKEIIISEKQHFVSPTWFHQLFTNLVSLCEPRFINLSLAGTRNFKTFQALVCWFSLTSRDTRVVCDYFHKNEPKNSFE